MPWQHEHDENSIEISNLSDFSSADRPDKASLLGDFQSPGDILGASGELLAHFHRSGLRYVPNSVAETVDQWRTTLDAEFDLVNSSAAGIDAATGDSESTSAPATGTPASPQPPDTPPTKSPRPSRLTPITSTVVSSLPYPGAALPVDDAITSLDSLAKTVAGCTRCKALARCRTQTVFGEGSPQPRFVFFGEAPGAEEDKTGRPFVGESGQLLTKMIEAIHLKRDEVYLLNTIKCRPPGNRNPAHDELANCREYFETQLQLLRPEYIICLGAVSAQALLQTKLSIGRLRQSLHQYHDSKVLAIYHPAYLLRNPDAKRAAWSDLQLLMKDAGLSSS